MAAFDLGNSKYIAVPSNATDMAGAIVYWRLSGATRRLRLEQTWVEMAGLDPKLLPRQVSPDSALRAAVKMLESQHTLVRPLGPGEGWAVVAERVPRSPTNEEDAAELRLDVEPAYDPLWLIRLESESDGTCWPEVRCARSFADLDNKRASVEKTVREYYTAVLGEAADISTWLVQLAKLCNAVRLRDTGGIYFVPRDKLPTWKAFAGAVRSATSHVFFEIPALATDEAVRAILDAVMAEAEAEIAAMEIGATDLGKRGATNRVARAQRAIDKTAEYEALLGVSLETVRDRMMNLQATLAEIILGGVEEEAG